MNGSFSHFVALNPIKTLIRVMHRNFTPQVRFFWVHLENSVGLRSENVLCPGDSLNPSGEQSWSFLLFWSQKIFWLCLRPVPQVVTIIKAQDFACFFFFPRPKNSLSFCNFIPEFLVEHLTWDVVHNSTRLAVSPKGLYVGIFQS